MRVILSVVLMVTLILIGGCQSLGYYAQSVKGQWQVIHSSKSIDSWLQRSNTSAELRAKLEQVKSIRQFASTQLKLPDNKSYTYYADLKRPYVVWNIFAAPELSLEPYLWCYPIIGCQAYRGYFSKQPAVDLAQQIKAKGYDVSVGGVKAYSTLGWFNDPVLNTFVNYSQINLASLIFHELSHQIVYVKGDTVFNESFATLVENKGVEVWLKQQGKTEQLAWYQRNQQFENIVLDLITRYKTKLTDLYRSELEQVLKLAQKQDLFAELKLEYQKLKTDFDFKSPWDKWFAQDLNNANLVAVGTYYDKVDEFEKLFYKSGEDFSVFYAEVKRLAKLKKTQRDQYLASLDNF